uniref:Uncharacterized protein n=1 Tax=Caudovirales sp. ctCpR1 TaxID=2825760 RepID=A0A8S5V8S9_9CAUD|nr:MAG TPA: hypothetical protein [Caudovirales sp. ctCpR1]
MICCRAAAVRPYDEGAARCCGLPGCRPAAGLLPGCRPAADLLPGCRSAAGLAIRLDPVQLVQPAHFHPGVFCLFSTNFTPGC